LLDALNRALPNQAAMLVDFGDQFGHMFGRGKLRNPVAQVKYMAGMVAETVE
jgi:hypothetical protein